ncbi:MAG: bifunctional hydroxymethylpyrimidine kinase/phosphomethylpyrimidine kinase [Actinomycetota bacterium]|nr:bifunctional hydroxymethylpyrimidine kinase/phosphomethylpyrimidine kinase [Actinomycetota bacterium]
MDVKKILLIGGTDPSGGAGVVLDSFIAAELNAFPYAVVTAVIAQSSTGVFAIQKLDTEIIEAQLEAVLSEGGIAAVKSGVLHSKEAILVLSTTLERLLDIPFVLDPVLVSSSGTKLLSEDGIGFLKERLFPKATIVTPNLEEAEALSKIKIDSQADIKRAADIILESGPKWVLVKGGHLEGDYALDYLFGEQDAVFALPRIERGEDVRGTGCIFATSLAVNLLNRKEVAEAVQLAKENTLNKIRSALHIGRGRPQISFIR